MNLNKIRPAAPQHANALPNAGVKSQSTQILMRSLFCSLFILTTSACADKAQDKPKLLPQMVTSGGKIELPTLIQGDEPQETRFLVRNFGQGLLEVTSIELEGDDVQIKISPELPASLKTHQFVTVRLRMSPNTVESVSGTLIVKSNGDPQTLKVPISGKSERAFRCESDNPCKDAHFDAKLQRCVITDVRGFCDDNDPCTKSDKCMSGTCVGLPVHSKKCKNKLCEPGLCDDAPVPPAYLDKNGQLRKDWRAVHKKH